MADHDQPEQPPQPQQQALQQQAGPDVPAATAIPNNEGRNGNEDIPLPVPLTVKLYVKKGLPLSASRVQIALEEFPFTNDVVGGFAVMQGLVRTRVERVENFRDYIWTNHDIYIAPNATSVQTSYQVLTEDDFQNALARRWRKARRGAQRANFQLLIQVWLQPRVGAGGAARRARGGGNAGGTGIHRATQNRIAAAALAVEEQRNEIPRIPPANTLQYQFLVQNVARQDAAAPIVVPDNATYAQLGVLDNIPNVLPNADGPHWMPVLFEINGQQVTMRIDARSLRLAIGIPVTQAEQVQALVPHIEVDGDDVEDEEHLAEEEAAAATNN